jgi:addiction module HigA family antidote
MPRIDPENFNYAAGMPLRPIHPGRTIRAELTARGISAHQAALSMRMAPNRLSLILNGTRGLSVDTALRLARFFGNGAQFWMNLQAQYDLAMAARENGARIESEVTPAAA